MGFTSMAGCGVVPVAASGAGIVRCRILMYMYRHYTGTITAVLKNCYGDGVICVGPVFKWGLRLLLPVSLVKLFFL